MNKKFLEALIDASESAIYLKDINGKYLMINKKGAKSIGCEVADLIGKDDKDIFPPNVAERVMALDKSVFEQEDFHGEERADGDQYFYSHKFILIDPETNEKILAGISTDISDLKRTEKKLVEAQIKAETANQHKSTFLQNMSHELRTPLNAIIGFSSILAGESGVKSMKIEENITEYANLINSSGVHLLSIINDLLDLSKIEAGEQDFNEVEIDIKYEISSCIRTLKNLALENTVTLEEDIPDQDFYLKGDEKILRQLLYNLISNSIKYSLPDNNVKIRLSLRDHGGIDISIIDNGVGMTQDELAIAMIPFRRIADTRNSEIVGTGLGLPLVDAFIKLFQGRLNIQSVKGEGTVATLHFPSDRTIID